MVVCCLNNLTRLPLAAAGGAAERGEEVSMADDEKDAAMGPAARENEETEVRSGLSVAEEEEEIGCTGSVRADVGAIAAASATADVEEFVEEEEEEEEEEIGGTGSVRACVATAVDSEESAFDEEREEGAIEGTGSVLASGADATAATTTVGDVSESTAVGAVLASGAGVVVADGSLAGSEAGEGKTTVSLFDEDVLAGAGASVFSVSAPAAAVTCSLAFDAEEDSVFGVLLVVCTFVEEEEEEEDVSVDVAGAAAVVGDKKK